MQHIKSLLNFIDIILGTFWSVTLIEVVPLLTSGSTVIFTQIDSLIKILFSLAGLVYLIFRIINYWHMSKLNRELKKLEIYKLSNQKTIIDFKKEFLSED
jgi:hypothetical protein